MRLTDESQIACIFEVMVRHVDLTTHKTSNFPDDVKARIDVMVARHKPLPVPNQVGHKIEIPRKT